MISKTFAFIKKEPMLLVSVLAAIVSLFITPPSAALLSAIDWKTLATLLMLLAVLDGFKAYDLFRPVIRLAGHFKTRWTLGLFLVFAVFFSSMFVTNDVSLIIFVPLTIILFRAAEIESYILPLLCLENIAAVRGSLLTPFGSPQNLFLFGKSGLSAGAFILMMLPLWLFSIGLLVVFIRLLFRKDAHTPVNVEKAVSKTARTPENQRTRIVYLALFAVILITIVSRTTWWPYVTAFVLVILFIFDRKVFLRVDYVLLVTFLCFFIFSSSVTANPAVAGFLSRIVTGHEYLSSILISQVISNVPAAIVLWPFTENLPALIYGLDSAGLVWIIGSLASVINLRIYNREYPGRAMQFIKTFEIVCLPFFAIVFVAQWGLLALIR